MMTSKMRDLKVKLQKDKDYLFSLDVETDGLYGKPIAIGAIVYNRRGNEIDRFILKRNAHIYEPYVIEHVLPQLEGLESVDAYYYLLERFTYFYNRYKANSMFIVHMGIPVEAFLFREMRINDLIGDFDAPYPLFDIASDLLIAGEDPTSPDAYVGKHNLNINFIGSVHNPLYDAMVAAEVYIDLHSTQIIGDYQ